jgi:hypothetical protein
MPRSHDRGVNSGPSSLGRSAWAGIGRAPKGDAAADGRRLLRAPIRLARPGA